MSKHDEFTAPTTEVRDDIAPLLRHAGQRRVVSAERMEQARRRVRAHWLEVVAEQGDRGTRFDWRAYAIAATLVLGLAVGYFGWRGAPPAPLAAMASVERSVGDVLIDDEPAVVGRPIRHGAVIAAARGRAAIRLAGGQSLRIDAGSRLALESADRMSLASGAVYVDSGAHAGSPVSIETPYGTARDIGTQFQVRVGAQGLSIGVREGSVEFSRADRADIEIGSGYFVALLADGSQRRDAVEPNDPRWDWAEEVAPAFETDGATLFEFLTWFARESGLRLVWTGDADQQSKRVRISGSIRGATPQALFDQVRLTTPFGAEIDGTVLEVSMP